jgi:hypothetical protein
MLAGFQRHRKLRPAVLRALFAFWLAFACVLAPGLATASCAGLPQTATSSWHAAGAPVVPALFTYDTVSTSTTPFSNIADGATVASQRPSEFQGSTVVAVRLAVAAEDGVDLSGATTVSGRFPSSAEPGSILVRRDPVTGEPTSYQEYGPDGLPTKRVDLTGSSHGGIETPHVHEYGRNTNRDTGQTFVNPGPVRPANPNEIP